MHRFLSLAMIALVALLAAIHPSGAAHAMTDVLKTPYDNADGTSTTLSQEFGGKVILVVNTASKCGYTKQYAGLEAIYRRYKDQGLVVVAFPSNDFGGQEPGTNAEIAEFCSTKYDVTFPLKAKMPTKGAGKSPLYQTLTGTSSPFPGEVGWNFEKFLIGRDGKIVGRYASKVTPESAELTGAIEKALAGG